MRDDQRGAIYLETLVGFLTVLFFFFGVIHLSHLFAAKLIVRRAAAAAVRAAVVVLPDDGRFYADGGNRDLHRFVGLRRADIERAVRIVLSASPDLIPVVDERHGEAPTVKIEGRCEGHELITAVVAAHYRCFSGPFGFACGADRSVLLTAKASLPYQGADYEY